MGILFISLRKLLILMSILGLWLCVGLGQMDVQADTEATRIKHRGVKLVSPPKKSQKAIDRPTLKVEAKYLRKGKKMDIRPGTDLSFRDNYALAFSADRCCYVYVFQFDSRNKTTQFFPNSDFNPENNPVAPQKNYRLPIASQGWLSLDENIKEVELVVLAHPTPLPNPLKTALNLTGHNESNLFPFPDEMEPYNIKSAKSVRQSPDDILFVWRNKFGHVN